VAVGANIEVLAGMHRLHKQTVAAAVGISPQQLNNIVRGTSGMSLKLAQRLTRFFAVPMETLLDGEASAVALAGASSYNQSLAQRLATAEITVVEVRQTLGIDRKPSVRKRDARAAAKSKR